MVSWFVDGTKLIVQATKIKKIAAASPCKSVYKALTFTVCTLINVQGWGVKGCYSPYNFETPMFTFSTFVTLHYPPQTFVTPHFTPVRIKSLDVPVYPDHVWPQRGCVLKVLSEKGAELSHAVRKAEGYERLVGSMFIFSRFSTFLSKKLYWECFHK